MLKNELKKILKKYYGKTMINAIVRGAKPMHMDYARELHNTGVLELNSWADITEYLKKEEEKAQEQGETDTSSKASA